MTFICSNKVVCCPNNVVTSLTPIIPVVEEVRAILEEDETEEAALLGEGDDMGAILEE